MIYTSGPASGFLPWVFALLFSIWDVTWNYKPKKPVSLKVVFAQCFNTTKRKKNLENVESPLLLMFSKYYKKKTQYPAQDTNDKESHPSREFCHWQSSGASVWEFWASTSVTSCSLLLGSPISAGSWIKKSRKAIKGPNAHSIQARYRYRWIKSWVRHKETSAVQGYRSIMLG